MMLDWTSEETSDLPGPRLAELSALASELVARARTRNLRLCTAESCSLGALAQALGITEGGAGVLFGGFVTYAADAKVALLDVPHELIERHSAVSTEVVRAMAVGVLGRAPGVDLALAVSGVTGEHCDDRGNPRGRVHLAAALRGARGLHRHCEFGDFPPPVLVNATLRHAIDLGLKALRFTG